ncbi:O-antigen ligase family protein [Sphingobacterium zeae]|uniref:O-antigen ligase family protein n=1 Tax=Sphingobacterium zeae TaxID=1776859 RepID=UPI0027D92DB2|nr:O-antigen ligase family protein [Sphingobacterium zeae]
MVFKHILKFNVWICVLSVVLMLVGLHAGKKIDHYNNLRPDFAGLYRHSMVLSAMCGIAILTLIYGLRNSGNRKFKLFSIFGIIFCFIGLIQSGSRAAIAGLLLAIIAYFFILYRNKLHRFVSILFLITAGIIMTFPLWESKADFVMSKFNSKSSDLQYGSRDIKWNQRLREFSSSPIIGIGFASVDIHGDDDFNTENGIIEPGTSWLAVLSMTGLLGFIFFATNNYTALRKLLKDKNNENNIFILSCLILMLFYMLFEGIVFASGTLLFAFYWLLIGQINVKNNNG